MPSTCVVIVGAGPAGLATARGLADAGVPCLVLEKESRAAIENQPRAGYLEEWAARALSERGIADPLGAGAGVQGNCEFRFEGACHVFDYEELTGDRHVVYPQQQLVRDLLHAYVDEAGGAIEFEVADVGFEGVTTGKPAVSYTDRSGARRLVGCEVIVGADGARGVSRRAITDLGARVLRSDLGVRWLTVLAQAPPSCDRVAFGMHRSGFAMFAARGPRTTRYYLELPAGDEAEDWPDERIWQELTRRLEAADRPPVSPGPITEKRVLDMHNYVVEPMSLGRLHLVGDSAHLLAPIAAKGMNLALSDAFILTDALADHLVRGSGGGLAEYTERALQRVWQYQEFTQWLSEIMHGPSSGDPFRARTAGVRLRRLTGSRRFARAVADLYLGIDAEF
ncbi:4-hydroxybenzoate 3-monooxygenase [Streptomyces sp. TS71-3]|uniref:4-hydroxybenzoate 3-monooxygenase n=1 Tax=Streptomyces sp. TS71-3 TaxID=2733862 RepID=UPI001BB3BF19|nr:4-hydroxybenzoate 3-monooxygenase [Streptomyces sp. TS71-3]